MSKKLFKLNPEKVRRLATPYKEVFDELPDEDKSQVKSEVEYLETLMGMRQIRKELGLTQAEIAKRSQIPRATITKIENGQRNATIKTMFALADAMGKKLQISWV